MSGPACAVPPPAGARVPPAASAAPIAPAASAAPIAPAAVAAPIVPAHAAPDLPLIPHGPLPPADAAPPGAPTWRSAAGRLTRAERGLFVAGLVLLVGLVAEWIVLWSLDPRLGRSVLAAVTAEMVLGREGGIPVGLLAGVPPWLLFQLSVVQDLATGFLAYPALLVLLHRVEQRAGRLRRFACRLRARAMRHRAGIRRWGPVGLFLFMLLPFLVNGPLVAALAGRLSGLRTRLFVVPIVLATTVAALAWTFFLRHALRLSEGVAGGLGVAVLSALAGAAFLAWLVPQVRRQERVPAK